MTFSGFSIPPTSGTGNGNEDGVNLFIRLGA
jgi:hypothetical protein